MPLISSPLGSGMKAPVRVTFMGRTFFFYVKQFLIGPFLKSTIDCFVSILIEL